MLDQLLFTVCENPVYFLAYVHVRESCCGSGFNLVSGNKLQSQDFTRSTIGKIIQFQDKA